MNKLKEALLWGGTPLVGLLGMLWAFKSSEQVLYRTYGVPTQEVRYYLCDGEWTERHVTVQWVYEQRVGRVAVSQEVRGAECP